MVSLNPFELEKLAQPDKNIFMYVGLPVICPLAYFRLKFEVVSKKYCRMRHVKCPYY